MSVPNDVSTGSALTPEVPGKTGPVDLLAELEGARQALAGWQERFADYSGNNPDKYRTDIVNARSEVDRLTQQCKRLGLLETTDIERIGYALDALHPKAQSREVLEYEGRYFQKRFSPGRMSRSRKTVTAWDHQWHEVPLGHEDVQRLVDPAGLAQRQAQVEAVRKHWPWSTPAGGLKLQLQVGDPALLSAEAGKSAIGYTKGRPDLRVSLKVALSLSDAALERCLGTSRNPAAKELWLGRNAAGQECFLVKAGRGAADIALDRREA